MMKRKIVKTALSFCLILAVCLSFCTGFSAENAGYLTISGKTVYQTDSLARVSELFGAPKLSTPSLFGGVANTYYSENYSDFLFLETNAKNEIVVLATVTPGYKTSKPGENYGEEWSGIIYASNFHDHICYGYSADRKIDAGSFFFGKDKDLDVYNAAARRNPRDAMRVLQEHGVEMTNAVLFICVKTPSLFFSEEIFQVNLQLNENGSNFYEYAESVGKDSYVNFCASSPDESRYISPLFFSKFAYSYTIPEDTSFPAFNYAPSGSDSRLTTVFVNPAILDKGNRVELTEKEKNLLSEARRLYAASVEKHNEAISAQFTEAYQYQTTPLSAGVMNQDYLEACTGFLNAVRAGAGLPLLTHDPVLSEGAQHKAVLTAYLSQAGISNPDPHFPPQPEGVPDTFYAKAQLGGGENLYYTSFLGGNNVIGSIANALQEAYGDIIACGHRYNLLDPNWTSVGFGSCEGQGVHKLRGYQAWDGDIVAWPPEGIMLVDAVTTSCRWTAKSVSDRYQFPSDCTVVVENLNTGAKWEFTDENASDYEFYRLSGQVTFYHPGISFSTGDVVRVTLRNLIDNQDGSRTDYSYRVVFQKAYLSSGSAGVSGISVSQKNKTMRIHGTGDLGAVLSPENPQNAWVDWVSSDPSVVSVDRCGGLTSYGKTGTVTITAISEDGNFRDSCTVMVTDILYGDVNRDQKITTVDGVILSRYLARWSVSVDETTSDVNGDGKITTTDAVLLKRYLAKWKVPSLIPEME